MWKYTGTDFVDYYDTEGGIVLSAHPAHVNPDNNEVLAATTVSDLPEPLRQLPEWEQEEEEDEGGS